jgi:hypothetical protein
MRRDPEKHFQEYVGKLTEMERKESEAARKAAAAAARAAEDWSVWGPLLQGVTRKLHARSDAGDGGATLALGGGDGGEEGGGRGASAIELAARYEKRITALRGQAKELELSEVETREKLHKAEQKIAAHAAMSGGGGSQSAREPRDGEVRASPGGFLTARLEKPVRAKKAQLVALTGAHLGGDGDDAGQQGRDAGSHRDPPQDSTSESTPRLPALGR